MICKYLLSLVSYLFALLLVSFIVQRLFSLMVVLFIFCFCFLCLRRHIQKAIANTNVENCTA